MPELRDVSSIPTALILHFKRSILSSQLVILMVSWKFPIYGVTLAYVFLGCKIRQDHSAQDNLFVLKIHTGYLFSLSGFCIGAACQHLTYSRWIQRTAVRVSGALFCGQTSTQEDRKQWEKKQNISGEVSQFWKGPQAFCTFTSTFSHYELTGFY